MYLRAVCAMAMSNDLVKTAMLDLPPTYLLDYVDNPDIRSAARRYHRQTLKLFRDAQAHFEANDPGTWREDDVSAFLIAVVLLMHNHVSEIPCTYTSRSMYVRLTVMPVGDQLASPSTQRQEPGLVPLRKVRLVDCERVRSDTSVP